MRLPVPSASTEQALVRIAGATMAVRTAKGLSLTSGRRRRSRVDERLQLLRAARVAELTQGLGFDLADALAGYFEILPHLFQGVVALFADAEAHPQDLFFAGRKGLQDLSRLFGEVHVDDRFGRRDDALVLDEVAEMRVFFFSDGRLEGDGLFGDLENLAHLVERQLHLLGDLFRRRLASVLLNQVTRGANELVDRLDHVDRDADRASLVG